MYDVIGDVHGQGDLLHRLLARMGYEPRKGAWRPPAGRQAIFVGDLIDRGPDQLEVLDTVRRMVDAGHARLVLGNHEFNAIGYYLHLRPRSEKNRTQHAAFLAQVGEDSALHKEWVDWFRPQPMALDLEGLRVVHAWWDDAARGLVNDARAGEAGLLDDEVMHRLYCDKALERARKRLTCGVEWELPPGHFIEDKEGHKHPDARLAVWRHEAERLREIAIVPSGSEHLVPDMPIPHALRQGPVTGAPILFGHHWFSGPLKLESPKVACLDWSAAKGGPLVAYRWHGEPDLRHENLVAVGGGLS
jgi:Calcineurin-like phosphoesterase